MIFSVTDGGVLMSSVPAAQGEGPEIVCYGIVFRGPKRVAWVDNGGSETTLLGPCPVASGYPGQPVARSRSPAKTTPARLDWQRRHPAGTLRFWPCLCDRIGCPGDPRQRDEPAMTKGRTWFF